MALEHALLLGHIQGCRQGCHQVGQGAFSVWPDKAWGGQVRGTPLRRWATGVRTGADYARGLWSRLNGTAPSHSPLWAVAADGPLKDLPWPRADPEARAGAIKDLSHSIDTLDKRLIEASKVRKPHIRI